MKRYWNKWVSSENSAIIGQRCSRCQLLSISQLILIFTLSSLAFCSAIIGTTHTSKKGCDKQRKIFGINNETFGIISDGPKDYPMDSHCEWLITTNSMNNTNKYITLKFVSIETECSYDHIYVFDGSSYESNLLGSFSGKTLPIPVTATSGSMLILLYSDTNYVLQGFVAQFSITDCPMNCSGHGVCLNHKCVCDRFWADISCDTALCPNNCSGNGLCVYDELLATNSYCNCSHGFAGESCSYRLEINDNYNNNNNQSEDYSDFNNNFQNFDSNNTHINENEWHLLSSNKYNFPSRAGHASVYSPITDSLYTFGGRNFDIVFGDLLEFNFKHNKWTNLTSFQTNYSSHPKSVWGHAMVYFDNNIIMFGGIFSNSSLSNELWFYQISNNEWHLKATDSKTRVPSTALHSLTLVDNEWLYAFGGRLEDGSFSSHIYRINLIQGLKQWELVEPVAGKSLDRRLAGHTAVYDETTKSILVYGGVSVDYARFSRLSGQLHAFHVEKRIWTRLRFSNRDDPFGIGTVPLERAFHSSTIINNNYLLIYGGYTHRHSREEVCYDNSFYLYSLKCHKWISFNKLTEDTTRHNFTARDGVFSHTFATRNNTVLILGGYSGTVRNELWAYVLPKVISSCDQNICSLHRKRPNCLSNPLCGWCERSDEGFCMHYTRKSECSPASFTTEPCPGLCPLLPDCYSCLAWKQYNTTDVRQKSCLWCVQSAQCYQNDGNKYVPHSCQTKSKPSSKFSSHSPEAWWGSHPIIINGSASECRTRNFRPGLTMLKYRYPSNFDQPDEVSIINQTSEHVIFHQEFSGERESQSDSAVNVARILGYIHPLGAQPFSENYLRLYMGSSGSQALLKVSSDDSERLLELTANHTSTSYMRTEARRADNSRIFTDTSIDHKFLIDFIVNIPIKAATTFSEPDTMQLVWNANPIYREVLSYEFLEPFRNDSQCKYLNNCLSCVSNSGCGWCDFTNSCMVRIDSNNQSICHNSNGEQQYLILESSHCKLCSDFIYCKNCASISHCEWLVEEAHCVRRGRYEDAVRHPNMCPLDCHQRTSCASCLGDPGRCAWCEQTKTCFLFSTYTTSFMFGGCQEWIDEDHHSASSTAALSSKTSDGTFHWCRDCSKHTTCMSCLSDLRCGWCSATINPMIGLCTEGDFHKPNLNCETAIHSKFGNSTELGTTKSVWSYDICPDIDECELGLHNCHGNASCHNTPTSFTCTCSPGYKGDGVNSCLRTCDVQCIHGYCSESPDYYCICELGWTGIDCSTNCGCNNHSTCTKGIGICDECQDYTEGEFCEICSRGSFGNATNSLSCQKCNCNGHGDITRGLCDSITGHCYCTDNTEGINCERCKSGHYGDPRNNGKCYLECLPRGLVVDARNGSFGSKTGYIASTSQLYCLWIFTIHRTLDTSTLYSLAKSSNSISTPLSSPIALTIERNMKVECPDSNIQVYDGVPDFVASGGLRKKLGYYCGSDLREDIHLVAYSGFLTVFFERHDPTQGFNASFVRLDCPNSCSSVKNRECVNDSCICADFYTGSDCDINACPNNCSAEKNQGTCDLMNGRCVCMPKFGDKDCSQHITPNRLVWSTLFNSEAASSFLPSLSMYLPRMGHSLDSTESALWLFAGYSSTRGQVGDMFRFNLISSRWEEIKPSMRKRDGQPQARHFHATTLVGDYIFLYGGLSQVNGVLGDFWCFKTSEQAWTKLTTIGEIPALAGHTLTAYGNKLLLIGGYSPTYGFLEKQFEYDIAEHQWKVSNASGASPTGIYGHTALYHSQSNSIYVYGGIVYDVDRTIISGDLYALHLTKNLWFRLPSDEQINPISARPKPRYFHAAVSTEFYMIIIGGRSNDSNIITHSNYAYIYKCNKWISLEMDGILTSGELPPPAVGLSAALQDNNLYVFGGSNGRTLGNLYRLSLPKDLCQLFSHSRLGCLRHIGCSYCAAYENGSNRTFCYSQDLSIPQSCYNPKGASEVAQGISCGVDLLERRNCYQYKTCIDCVAAWPIYASAKQVCQWCSNCQQGRCIPSGASCERETECNLPQRVVTLPQLCPLRSCLASDCEKCTSMNICMWTRQVLRSSELGHTLNVKPIFDWTCVRKILQDASSFPVESMPPLSCPPRCQQHTNCTTCLESAGGEGGWHECSWTENANECMSPSFVRLRCEGGLCGSVVLQGSRAQCPVSCSQLTQSAHCLSRPHCGWCAFNGSRVDGRGICMEGGLFGPIGGICKLGQVVVFGRQLPPEVSQWFAQSDGHPKWAYLEKPKENECLNGHHTCDERHEECVDLEDGFMCRCKQGYIIEGNQCKPTCNQGCIFGTCVAPDVCQCNFGYIGADCSLACECNGHSNCAGINRLSDCLECQNHTQGSQCQKCKPFFVGNPINSGKCVSCKMFCNSHSDICLSPDLINSTSSSILYSMTSVEDLSDIVQEGPLSEAICLNCQHNTQGVRCDECIPGFFKATDNIRDGCRSCHCHGHGDMCNPLNGENCNCQNNTENDRQCNQKNSKNLITPCWQLQCSKCKEYFLGVPTNGHQCYRHMFLDKDYCFDPNTQEECTRKPNKLLNGRTVFFAVQPRYMNVDIRIVVDVTKGGVDFFLSAKEDTFVVDVNKSTGIHYIWLDKKYTSDITSNSGDDLDSLLLKKDFLFNDSSYGISSSQMINFSPQAQHSGPTLKLRHQSASDLIYYLTITDPNEFLVIRNLQNRLVITIPHEVHDLRSTRFYMVLRGVGSETLIYTYGNLFFRQDQSRIDLFVFFSVFFSCFFLFLAACVVVWKIKQAFDLRRARRLHAAEMKHMASRPFAVVLALIDPSSDPDDFEFALSSPTHHLQGNIKKGRGFRFKGSHSSLKDSPKAQVYPEIVEKYLIRPVAVEPTSDGVSAVVTTLVQLPGGPTAPIRMALGSALVTVRGSHHILNANHHYSSSNNVAAVGAGVWRAAMRRRAHMAF